MLKDEFPYLDNVTIDPRLIGFESGTAAHPQFTSASRLDMYASHLKQAMCLDGAEFPLQFTGFEHNLGEYEYDKSRRTQDAEILAVIPKYPIMTGMYKIHENPSFTVVYLGLEDKKIHYFVVDQYTRGSDGYGYENVIKNRHLLKPHQFLPKDTKIVTSPIHKDGMYCLGVNANVAYMTSDDTIEDAMPISRSLADKMATTAIYRKTILVNINQHPLNIYGDDAEFKFLPDIGEYVGDDGVLCAFRRVTDATFVADTMPGELCTPQYLHDDIIRVDPNAKILDIDFYVARSSRMPKHIYQQVDKYQQGIQQYYLAIIDIYQKYKKQYEIAPEMNTLVTNAAERLMAAGVRIPKSDFAFKPKVQVVNKAGRPIDFMHIDITYAVKRPVSLGFKLTGRDGAKGVVCKIYDNEDMPVDEQGFRADLIIDPAAVVSRMNTGQLYEQAINRVSEFVRRYVEEAYRTNIAEAERILFDYYNDINPNYANLIRSVKNTPDLMKKHIEDCIKNGIYLHTPPALETLGPDLIRKLKSKWNVVISPVTFVQRDEDGNVINTVKTERPVCIGSKYVLLLCKIPDPASPGVAHLNQYNTPMKPPSDIRHQHPISFTPIRFGEDEARVRLMDVADTDEDIRLMCLQAGSPAGVDKLVETILTCEHPTRIERVPMSTQDLINSNSVIALFHHMMLTAGIDSKDTVTDKPMPMIIPEALYDDTDEDIGETSDDDV